MSDSYAEKWPLREQASTSHAQIISRGTCSTSSGNKTHDHSLFFFFFFSLSFVQVRCSIFFSLLFFILLIFFYFCFFWTYSHENNVEEFVFFWRHLRKNSYYKFFFFAIFSFLLPAWFCFRYEDSFRRVIKPCLSARHT